MQVTVHRRLDELDAWDELAPVSGAYASSRWLSTFDQRSAHYLELRDDRGVAGLASCFVVPSPGSVPAASEPKRLFAATDDAAAWRDSLYPYVLVGAPRGYSNHLIVREAGAISHLRAAVLELARAEGAKLASYTYVSPAEGQALVADAPHALALFATVEYYIPITTWDGYLAGMGQKRRRHVRLGSERFATSGFHVDQPRLGEVLPQLVEMFAVQQMRFHPESSPDAVHELFDSYYKKILDVGLEDAMRIFCVFDGSRLISAAEYLTGGGIYYGRTGGSHPDAPRDADIYFNCGYYAPIRAAIAEGAHELHDGISAGELKLQRGCRARAVWTVLDPVAPLAPELVTRLRSAAHARFVESEALLQPYFDAATIRDQLGAEP